MTKLGVTIEGFEDIVSLLNGLSSSDMAKVLPHTASAFRKSARAVEKAWKGFGRGDKLEGVESLSNSSGAYIRGIKLTMNGPFDYTVSNDSKGAERIEYGTPAFDMKATHPYGAKSRVAIKKDKNGMERRVPYLIIPFRWGEKEGGHFRNIMPDDVVAIVSSKKFGRSKITELTHTEDNFSGVAVERSDYKWGARITEDDTDMPDAVGMVNMGGKSGRFTFRVISADSPSGSWINPGIKARNVTVHLAKMMGPYVEKMVEMGIKADLGI